MKRAGILSNAMLIGELSLNGELRPVPGALAMAYCAQEPWDSAVSFFLPKTQKKPPSWTA